MQPALTEYGAVTGAASHCGRLACLRWESSGERYVDGMVDELPLARLVRGGGLHSRLVPLPDRLDEYSAPATALVRRCEDSYGPVVASL